MESTRTFLFIAFAFLTFLLYQQWQEEHKPPPVKLAPVESSIESYTQPLNDFSSLPTTGDGDLSSEIPKEIQQQRISTKENSLQPIVVTTDRLKVVISPTGGNFVSAELLQYREQLDDASPPINILENRNNRTFLALSGLYGENAPDFKKNVAVYTSDQTTFEMTNSDEELVVDLHWVNSQGINYIKRFTFYPGRYDVRVEYIVTNTTQQKIANRMFTAIKRDIGDVEGQDQSGLGMKSYVGPAFSTEDEKYQKYTFDDIEDENLNEKTKNGWIALLQHYFVTAWVPLSETENTIDTTNKNLGAGNLTQIRITQAWQWIEPGETKTFAAKFYVGPKIQPELEKIARGLELTVDYGFLWWIGKPIFFLLIFFQGFVTNWGAAIILVTIAIKTILYPLARAQYRSFAKMRLLQPKMTAMKEQFGDDKQKMSMKMMELYKKEKVNPLGGCFPLLIQMPVFISLYWVLMESVELRHAPFIFWIKDMSVMDPLYVLPLLYGASMYFMQKMQPVSPNMDPMQQKMMQLMPVFMTVFFVFFPAGLVIYWLFNNLISISQQLYITKQFNKEQEAKKKPSK